MHAESCFAPRLRFDGAGDRDCTAVAFAAEAAEADATDATAVADAAAGISEAVGSAPGVFARVPVCGNDGSAFAGVMGTGFTAIVGTTADGVRVSIPRDDS